MPRPSEPELFDPRSVNDAAWGGLRTTHAEAPEEGIAPDAPEDYDRYGEEPWGHFQEGFRHPSEGERVHGMRWRSLPKRAGDVMTLRPVAVPPDASLQRVAQIMVAEDCGIVPVIDRGQLVGVVTDRDIVCRTAAHRLDQRRARAADVMSEDIASVDVAASLDEVLEQMEQHRVRRICVVDEDDHLLGIISMADLAREADVDKELQDAFLDISADRSFWERLR